MKKSVQFFMSLLAVLVVVIGFNVNTVMAMPTYLNDGALKLLSEKPDSSQSYYYMDTSSIKITDGGIKYYEATVNICTVDENYNLNRVFPVYYRFYYNNAGIEFTAGTGGWQNINNVNPMYKTGAGIILWYVNNSEKIKQQLNDIYE